MQIKEEKLRDGLIRVREKKHPVGPDWHQSRTPYKNIQEES